MSVGSPTDLLVLVTTSENSVCIKFCRGKLNFFRFVFVLRFWRLEEIRPIDPDFRAVVLRLH